MVLCSLATVNLCLFNPSVNVQNCYIHNCLQIQWLKPVKQQNEVKGRWYNDLMCITTKHWEILAQFLWLCPPLGHGALSFTHICRYRDVQKVLFHCCFSIYILHISTFCFKQLLLSRLLSDFNEFFTIPYICR